MPCNKAQGYVFILQNSLFSDVLSFNSTDEDVGDMAKNMSRINPGEFSVLSSIACEDHTEVKRRVLHSLKHTLFAGDFYEVTTQEALRVVRREANRIPAVSA